MTEPTNSKALVLITVFKRQYLLAAHFLNFSTTTLRRENTHAYTLVNYYLALYLFPTLNVKYGV